MIAKFPLDDTVAEILQKEADRLGLKLNEYIRMILGQHAATLEPSQKDKRKK